VFNEDLNTQALAVENLCLYLHLCLCVRVIPLETFESRTIKKRDDLKTILKMIRDDLKTILNG
jgi:hypothetical protein